MQPSARATASRLGTLIDGMTLNGACALAALVFAISVLIVAARAPQLGFTCVPGSVVLGVDPRAAAAGMRAGDQLVAINGHDTTNPRTRHAAMNALTAGEIASFEVLREGRRFTVTFPLRRDLPLSAATGVLLALGLLVVSF